MFTDSFLSTLPEPDARSKESPVQLDHATADKWLKGGLKADGLHEFYAAQSEDAISATSFALLVARIKHAAEYRPILWIREKHRPKLKIAPYGPGLLHLGLDPDSVILLSLPDVKAVLRAGLDSIRYGTSAVLIELVGRQPLLDLTATRRFALAAAELGVLVLISRSETEPCPSAAHTRWRIASAPSSHMEANTPGHPSFDLTLLRHRGGRDGLRLVLEWNRDTVSFRERPLHPDAAPIPRSRPAVAGRRTSDAERYRAA
jgi:protein ImuA